MACKTETVGDKIRQMSDAELAYVFSVVFDWAIPSVFFNEQQQSEMVNEFRENMLGFLESPAEEA